MQKRLNPLRMQSKVKRMLLVDIRKGNIKNILTNFSIRQFEEETEKLIKMGNTLNSDNIIDYIKNKKDKPIKSDAN